MAEVRRLKSALSRIYRQLKAAIPTVVSGVDTGRLRKRLLLSREMELRFSMEELEGFIRDLGIDPDNVPGETKEARVQALIMYFIRRQMPLSSLVNALRQERPGVEWPEL